MQSECNLLMNNDKTGTCVMCVVFRYLDYNNCNIDSYKLF